MKPILEMIDIEVFEPFIKSKLKHDRNRLGLLSSIDGSEIFVLMLDPEKGSCSVAISKLSKNQYPAMSGRIPQLHWFERALNDFFGLTPVGHPRLRSNFVENAFDPSLSPLRNFPDNLRPEEVPPRDFRFMKVAGEGIYELPVGPVHAGIIEPGHFRLSCLGEYIQNLELRFGFLHRGLEKTLVEKPWTKARFAAETASSDSACANSLAHATAVEDLLEIEVAERDKLLRTAAIEIERIAMHISDLGGMALDLGCAGVAASLSRLRGEALGLAELLSGSRFLKGYIFPGSVRTTSVAQIKKMLPIYRSLQEETDFFVNWFLENAQVQERLSGIGKVSKSLALDFGLVGVAARACGIKYDVREVFSHAAFPHAKHSTVLHEDGDCLGRTKVRAMELANSYIVLDSVLTTLSEMAETQYYGKSPENLAPDSIGCGIVESFRGELIHLIFTDSDGKIKRYCIKDPSFNNWTAMAIAARGNLIADFPVCNKSFSLSYSGHDL